MKISQYKQYNLAQPTNTWISVNAVDVVVRITEVDGGYVASAVDDYGRDMTTDDMTDAKSWGDLVTILETTFVWKVRMSGGYTVPSSVADEMEEILAAEAAEAVAFDAAWDYDDAMEGGRDEL